MVATSIFSKALTMPRRVMSLWIVVLLLAGLPGCGGGPSSTSTSNSGSGPGHLLYASLPANNSIAAFRVDKNTGVFTNVVGTPFPAGNSPGAMLIDPSGQFLYVVNRAEDTISLFDINTSVGSLTEVLPRVATGVTPMALAMTNSGKLLFVLNQISGSISVFSVKSSTGALAEIAGSPFLTAPNPVAMAVTPSG